jgi:hypothetical protein
MKKTKLGIFAIAIALFSACGDSHDDECHECHIAFDGPNGEIEVPINNSAGGEEFCGAELEEAEGADFSYILTEDYIVGVDTVPAGTYTEIHCEEHAH